MSQNQANAFEQAIDACRNINPAPVITVATNADTEADYPSWMRFTLDGALIDEILAVRRAIEAHSLEDASSYRCCQVGPLYSGEDESCRTDLDRLRVYSGGFFAMEASVKHVDTKFETLLLFFDSFFADVAAGRRYFSVDGRDDDEDQTFADLVAEDLAIFAAASAA